MTMHKGLHPSDDKDRLYVSRKEGERGLTNVKDCVDTSINDSLKKKKKTNHKS